MKYEKPDEQLAHVHWCWVSFRTSQSESSGISLFVIDMFAIDKSKSLFHKGEAGASIYLCRAFYPCDISYPDPSVKTPLLLPKHRQIGSMRAQSSHVDNAPPTRASAGSL